MMEAGQIVERFTIEAKLGEGGMATVYRVRHNTPGSYHALKLLKSSTQDIRRRLVEEGRVQASLRHANIVAVTDVLIVDGQPGLLMELVNRPTFEQWLWHNRATLEQAEALFRGVVAGVGRAHRAGLVHCDLKPGNVLLEMADGMVIPKVTDFGLAKILSDEDAGHSQTRSGTTLGTPQFMAPEQIRNAKGVDQRADIFALGCILYNLVCGRPPFQDPDILNLYNAIANGRYEPPETYAPGLPARISAAIAGALIVDRDLRTPDCDAMRILAFGEDDLNAAGGAGMWRGVHVEQAAAIHRSGGRTHSGNKAASTMGLPAAPASPAAPEASTWSRALLPLAALSLGLGVLGLSGVADAAWWAGSDSPASVDGMPPPEDVAATPQVEATAEAIAVPPTEPVAGSEPKPTPALEPAAALPVAAVEAGPAPTQPKVAAKTPAEQPTTGATTGHVSVTGEVRRVSLQSKGRSLAPGNVPPGTYEVSVQFQEHGLQKVGSVTIAAGQRVVVECDSALAMCKFK